LRNKFLQLLLITFESAFWNHGNMVMTRVRLKPLSLGWEADSLTTRPPLPLEDTVQIYDRLRYPLFFLQCSFILVNLVLPDYHSYTCFHLFWICLSHTFNVIVNCPFKMQAKSYQQLQVFKDVEHMGLNVWKFYVYIVTSCISQILTATHLLCWKNDHHTYLNCL
jgi:hypothetical protein